MSSVQLMQVQILLAQSLQKRKDVKQMGDEEKTVAMKLAEDVRVLIELGQLAR